MYKSCLWSSIFSLILNNITGCLGGCVGEDECGWFQPGRRIAGGEYVSRYTYPWMGFLYNNVEIYCGATLISPEHVLTAARCVSHKSAEDIHVAFGLMDTCQAVEKRNVITAAVSTAFIHEHYRQVFESNGYDKDAMYNDIAILLLDRTIGLPHVCLPCRGFVGNSTVTVLGWGHEKYEAPEMSCRQKRANLKTVDDIWCRVRGLICVFDKSSVCTGDTGGPALTLHRSDTLVVSGIILTHGLAHGPNCTSYNGYQLFTNVANHIPWIKRVMALV